MAKGKGKQRVAEKPSERRQSFQPRSIPHSRASLFQGSHSFFKRQFIHSSPAGAKLRWLKRIFRIQVVILKNQEKARRDLKRMELKAIWITKQIEAFTGAKYVPPPEMETESSDEEVEEIDKEVEEMRQLIHSCPADVKLTWLKWIFRFLVVILKYQEKDMRDRKRIALSKYDLITKRMEALFGRKICAPPEVEIESTDEEEEELDSDDE